MEFKDKLDDKRRGRALIIGNAFEGKEGLERKGCKRDIRMMKELFTRLDFKVTIFRNLPAKEMGNTLKKFAGKPRQDTHTKSDSKDDEKDSKGSEGKKIDQSVVKPDKNVEDYDRENRESDCFVLVISTHGEEIIETKGTGLPPQADVWRHAVCGEDEERLYVDDIINMFSDENAPGLAGKPKLFFLQACRPRGSDRLVRISNPRYDHGNYVSVKRDKEKGRAAKLLHQIVEKVLPKKISKTHKMIYTVDIAKNVDELYAGWLKETGDLEDACDEISGEDGEDDSTDEFSEEDNDTEEYDSSDDEEHIDEDHEDASRANDEEDAGMSRDSGFLPPPPANDEKNAGMSRDSGFLPPPPVTPVQRPQSPVLLPASPFDVVPINCPDDFLIMYPVMSGKAAMSNPSGSYLLQYLHKGENVSKLVQGYNLLQYLTFVCQDMAKYEFLPDLKMKSKPKPVRRKKLQGWMYSSIKHLSKNKTLLREVLSTEHQQKCLHLDETLIEQYLKKNVENDFTNKEMRRILKRILPFKSTACVVHRLRDNVTFSPISDKSPMAKVKDAFAKQ